MFFCVYVLYVRQLVFCSAFIWLPLLQLLQNIIDCRTWQLPFAGFVSRGFVLK